MHYVMALAAASALLSRLSRSAFASDDSKI
jgi:hypothetical protein